MKSSNHFRAGCWTLILTVIILFVILCTVDDFATLISYFIILGFFGIIIAIIFWIIGTTKKVKEVYVYVKDKVIDIFTVKNEISRRCPAALKAEILEKKKNSINVGIFDNNDKIQESIILSGTGSVSDELYEGQIIYVQD